LNLVINKQRIFAIAFGCFWLMISATLQATNANFLPSRSKLSSNAEVKICVDPDWLPFEAISSQGKHIGIAADYFSLLSKLSGLTFDLVITDTWAQSLRYVKEQKCDLLTLLNKTEQRTSYLNFTQPYLQTVVVLVGRDDAPFISDLANLENKTIAIVKGYIYLNYIQSNFPNLNVEIVDSMNAAMVAVAKGYADLTIASMPIALNIISDLGLSNLKIAGNTDLINDFRIGVSKAKPNLVVTLDEAISIIDSAEVAKIKRKWTKVTVETATDYTQFFQYALGFMLVLAFFIYRNITLRINSKKLSALNQLLQEANDKLTKLSSTDHLTQLANRAKVETELKREIKHCQRYLHSFSLIIFDIDLFKQVNDEFGHQVGDKVLIEVADKAKSVLRNTDVIGRWGGEEFIVLCPSTNLASAAIIAEKLRQVFCQIMVKNFSVTASFGVAEYQLNDKQESIISRADKALYQAKETGRNKVVVENEVS